MVAAQSSSVVGIVAAYKRPAMLHSLLRSLIGNRCLRYVIVVDNGSDPETENLCRSAPVPARYERPDHNLGCGGGAARGLELGLKDPAATHFCLFDDDAEATPGAIDALIEDMSRASADVAMPLVLDQKGHIAWFPGLRQSLPWKVIRQSGLTPEAYRRLCGDAPVPFTWAPWPVLALSARSVRECGYPRDDFWLCAEDLEYTLRLTHKFTGVLVPSSVCFHRPPSAGTADGSSTADPNALGGSHYLRFCLMLQNLSFSCTRLPHARRALRHLPGNYLRFLRTFGLHTATLRDTLLALWRGVAKGKPAGVQGADGFKQRFLKLNSAASGQRSV